MQYFITKVIGLYLNLLAVIAPRKAGLLGFALICHPFRGKITDRQRAFFHSAEQFKIKVKDIDVHVYRWGTGAKNIFLIHGWQSHSYRWKSYVDALDKSKYSIYAIDAPAHGLSSGKSLTVILYSEAVQALFAQIGNAHAVIGHSLGAFTAIYTFRIRPDLSPRKLVSLACPGEANEFFAAFKSMLGLTERALNLTINRFEEVINQTPGFFSAPYFASYLSMPGLIVHDEGDTETSVQNAEAIHKEWKSSQLIITKGIGHNLRSADVIKKTIEFIEHDQNQNSNSNYFNSFHLN